MLSWYGVGKKPIPKFDEYVELVDHVVCDKSRKYSMEVTNVVVGDGPLTPIYKDHLAKGWGEIVVPYKPVSGSCSVFGHPLFHNSTFSELFGRDAVSCFSGVLVIATSGSGKTYLSSKYPWIVDGDSLVKWPLEFEWYLSMSPRSQLVLGVDHLSTISDYLKCNPNKVVVFNPNVEALAAWLNGVACVLADDQPTRTFMPLPPSVLLVHYMPSKDQLAHNLRLRDANGNLGQPGYSMLDKSYSFAEEQRRVIILSGKLCARIELNFIVLVQFLQAWRHFVGLRSKFLVDSSGRLHTSESVVLPGDRKH
jgi:hypothetical protein